MLRAVPAVPPGRLGADTADVWRTPEVERLIRALNVWRVGAGDFLAMAADPAWPGFPGAQIVAGLVTAAERTVPGCRASLVSWSPGVLPSARRSVRLRVSIVHRGSSGEVTARVSVDQRETPRGPRRPHGTAIVLLTPDPTAPPEASPSFGDTEVGSAPARDVPMTGAGVRGVPMTGAAVSGAPVEGARACGAAVRDGAWDRPAVREGAWDRPAVRGTGGGAAARGAEDRAVVGDVAAVGGAEDRAAVRGAGARGAGARGAAVRGAAVRESAGRESAGRGRGFGGGLVSGELLAMIGEGMAVDGTTRRALLAYVGAAMTVPGGAAATVLASTIAFLGPTGAGLTLARLSGDAPAESHAHAMSEFRTSAGAPAVQISQALLLH